MASEPSSPNRDTAEPAVDRFADLTPLQRKPLVGTERLSVDGNGRIQVGVKLRTRLGDEFAMAIGEKGCVTAYPLETWYETIKAVTTASAINRGRQEYASLFGGTADDELHFDRQGRVVIPADLRALGNIKSKVVVIGAIDRVEIWAEDEFDKYQKKPDAYEAGRRERMETAYKKMMGGN